MQIFGSDGFRCKFGERFMTPTFIIDFANALAEYCHESKLTKPVVICRDTRATGLIIQNLISGILLYRGLQVVEAGISPTPALSSILANGGFSLGIMITASHNPSADNGIKLFGADGFKLPEPSDRLIEKGILNHSVPEFTNSVNTHSISTINGNRIYADSITPQLVAPPENVKILVDCSNGACSQIAPELLRLYKNVDFINVHPSGNNINLECGALESDRLLMKVRKDGYDYGAAFDGDGDRVIFVSAEYGVIESEKILFLLFQLLKKPNESTIVVATEICNLGLSHNLAQISAKLIETSVGDRFVTEESKNSNAVIGGEPSGHYYFPKLNRSMDGLTALVHFFKILAFDEGQIGNKLNALIHYRRIEKNISLSRFGNLNLDVVREQSKNIVDQSNEKLVVRQSIWDPVLRIYYDFINENRFSIVEEQLISVLERQNS